MKCLIADDDLFARKVLANILSDVGVCHATVDGQTTVAAFKAALDQGEPYNLLCLDIMMPAMDGFQTLQTIRKLEKAAYIDDSEGIKVIMTTSMSGPNNILSAYREGCEAYIVKPINKSKLFEEMGKLGLSVKTA